MLRSCTDGGGSETDIFTDLVIWCFYGGASGQGNLKSSQDSLVCRRVGGEGV